jgi:hypothetical protein
MELQATGSCLRGLEPLAYILGNSPQPWLNV